MIKGWRNNPAWRRFYQDRKEAKASAAWTNELLAGQKKMIEIQTQARDEARKHMAECHAQKVAAGEVAEPYKVN